MRKIALIAMVFILCLTGLSVAAGLSCTCDDNSFNNSFAPRLKYPRNNIAVLTADAPLKFSWWNDVMDTRGFILKVYKGYNMYAASLMLKEELLQDASSFSVKSSLFNDGQVYTWSLVRVSGGGYKSDRSFNSFKVIKKNG